MKIDIFRLQNLQKKDHHTDQILPFLNVETNPCKSIENDMKKEPTLNKMEINSPYKFFDEMKNQESFEKQKNSIPFSIKIEEEEEESPKEDKRLENFSNKLNYQLANINRKLLDVWKLEEQVKLFKFLVKKLYFSKKN